MAIDRADWHWDDTEKLYREAHGIAPEIALDDEQQLEVWRLAGNHIGLFVRWLIERGFQGEESDEEGCKRVRGGEMSGTDYLIDCCDCKFWDEDVREDILPFVEKYYSDGYFDDYCRCCLGDNTDNADKPVYGVISGDEDFQRLSRSIDKAYEEYCKAGE